MSTADNVIASNRQTFFSWQLVLIEILLLAIFAVQLEKPSGSLSGQIALEQSGGFHLYSYAGATHEPGTRGSMRENKVYALAIGPRSGPSLERGVWIKPDGTFKIDHLPVGEYSLKVHASGYQTNYLPGIFIDQGKVTQYPSPIVMNISEPSVTAASNCRVFTTAETPKFWINGSGLAACTVKVYQNDFVKFIQQGKEQIGEAEVFQGLSIYQPDKKTIAYLSKGKLVATLSRKLESDSEDWSHAEFKLASKLGPGDYFAVVEGISATNKTANNIFWFSVSDLGLIVKQAPDKILVRAIDLRTLKAKAGVNLQLVRRQPAFKFIPGATAKTGADGFATIAGANLNVGTDAYDAMILGTDADHRAYGGLTFTNDQVRKWQTYFYTERPIYRLGQTVCYKGISRMLGADGFHTPETGMPLTVTIEDPDNNKLFEGKLRTSSHGTFNGVVNIPEDGKTGAYQVTITYPDKSTSYNSFEVGQYRKPEYQVEVTPLTARVVAGQSVKARIKATYYFGAPVANARVKYSIYASPDWASRYKLMPRPDYCSYFDDWDDSDSSASYGGEYISEGVAQTDESGEAVVEFASKPMQLSADSPYSSDYVDKNYKIQAEVTDLSRISVIGSGNCLVTAGNFALFVEPNAYVVKAGQPLSVNVTAVDYDGKPVANQSLTVNLVRWLYDSVNNTYKGSKVEAQYNLTTGSDGKGTIVFRTNSGLISDTYYVTAQAKDSGGHLIFDQNSVWIASQNNPYVLSESRAEQEPLSLKLDKHVYKPGQTAKLMVTAPVTGKEGAEAIVAVESTKIFKYFLVPMTASAELVEVPIDTSYAPNVYVTVTFVGKGHQFYSQSEVIKVSPNDHFLNIAVKTDKVKYKPGDTVNYTIKAAYDNGSPATNCELSLGVVDESIYAIRPETAEDIRKVFWRRRDNWVNTLCSFPEENSGGPDKIEPRMRKNFRDTAAWMPDLITNNQGIALASIVLPDNLTTWRATVRGIDMQTDVGATTQKIIATQDLIVRLALPRFFTQGDQGLITAIVHNYTDSPQQIQLNLLPGNLFTIKDPLQTALSVAPDKAARYSWPVVAAKAGDALVAVKAIGQTAGDAMELTLPIRPLGVFTVTTNGGLLTDDTASASVPIAIGQEASLDTVKCNLSLAASSIGPVLGNYSALIDYPYGCTEQTMSRLMPSIVAEQLHRKLNVPLTGEQQQKFNKVFKQSMIKLKSYQHDDGGWGWWTTDETKPYLTAYVLEGLSLLHDAGYEIRTYIDEANWKKSINWLFAQPDLLYKQLNDPHHVQVGVEDADALIDLAYMEYVLAEYHGAITASMRDGLLNHLDKSYPEELSYLCLAFNLSHDQKAANKCYERLMTYADTSSGLVNFDHTRAMLNRLKVPSRYYDYSYRFTGVESTALALEATLVCDGKNTDRIEKMKRWILLQRGKDGWDTTKATAQVFRALLAEELASGNHGATDFETIAALSSSNICDLNFNSSNIYQSEKRFPLPATDKAQTLEIKKQGHGRLYYNTEMSYFRNLKPGQALAAKAMPDGLNVSRQFFRLEPQAKTSDGKIHFRSVPISNGSIKAGETVLMKVTVDAPVALPYVILDAALPSGGEVVSQDPREANIKDDDGDSLVGDWGSFWWTHQDVLDDRIVFFITSMPAGKSEFHAMVRMELPGTFTLNPLQLDGMYTKGVHAYSGMDTLKVLE